jgi:hypothetical protein
MAVQSLLLSSCQTCVDTLTSREAVFSTLAAARNSCSLSILADCLVTLSYYPMLRGLF